MKIRPLYPVLLGALCALPQLASAQVQLISWWNFDTGGTNGLSIDAQAGVPAQILAGAARTDAGGGRTGTGADRGMAFGAAQQRLYVPDASFLNQAGAANAISIAFWQKLNNVRSQTTLFANSTTVARAISAHTPWGDGTIYFDTAGCCDGGTQRISGMPTDPVAWAGQWNHVVLIKNGDTKEVYVNGVLGPSGTNTGPLPTDFTDLVIGNAPNLGEAVDGVLDDVALFAGALDAGQIAQLVGGASPASLVGPNDTDADGLPDAYEYRFFPGDLTKLSAAGDVDVDGLTDAAEFATGTNPSVADSDADGLADGVETNTGTWVGPGNTGTSPLLADTDGDGLNDGAETNTGSFVSATNAGTNPFVRDTDADGFTDGMEAVYSSSNPVNPASRPLRSGVLDIVAYWPFNDDSVPTQALDSVKGFPGELQNTTVYTADGEGRTGLAGDKAIDFGAGLQDNVVRVAAAGFLNIGATQNEIAVSFWQKLDAVVNSSSFWADSPTAAGSRGLNAHATWDNGNFYWDTNGCCDGGNRIDGPAGVDLVGTWHHIVFQKKGNAKEVWLDGVLTVSGSNTNPLNLDFTVLHIGSDTAAANIAGRIDDFAVYADALDAAQIAALAGGASPLSIVPPNTDSDGDGMPNAYETANGLNPNLDDRLLDLDSDGANNITEFLNNSLPNNPDTDGDTLKDGVETKTGTFVSAADTGTDPTKADSDGDSLGDAVETGTGTFVSLANTGTDPNKADTDGDTYNDAFEIQFGSNPFLSSSVPSFDLAWWPFNDTSRPLLSADVMHAYDAELQNGLDFSDDGLGRTGVAGDRAITFTGDTQMGKVLGADWLNVAAAGDSIAISYWQNLNAISDSVGVWGYSPSSTGGGRGFSNHSTWSNENYYFDTAGCCDGNQRISGPKGDVNLVGEWHHLVFQKNGADKQIWVDGVLTVSGSNPSPLPGDFTELTIGAEPSGANNMDGLLDDLAIFGEPLTEEQIARLAAGESPPAILAPATALAFTSITYNAGLNQIVLSWTSTPGKTYTLQSSETLTAWPVEINDSIPAGGTTTSYTHNLTAAYPGGNPAKLFYRVTQN